MSMQTTDSTGGRPPNTKGKQGFHHSAPKKKMHCSFRFVFLHGRRKTNYIDFNSPDLQACISYMGGDARRTCWESDTHA